ncbi:Phage tail repeat like [uncultured Caudovirales phage]|uniref:Phage tail repeat like n=1 Tax=uncultured Caudovirales phage TaxID=2100421 RepID=A0A6J5LXQ6_9CAUD|nr:Phage tail repeat like [uncultured Caudovirales phage]
MEIRISVTVGAGIQLYAVRPQQTAQGEGGTASWNDITGKPSTFPPSSHTHLISEVSALQSALDGKAATSHTHTVNQIIGLEDQLAEKADLVGGFIPTSQIPAQAVTEFLGDVVSQAAMLALTGQRGDWCIRTDQNRTYFLIADDASQLSNWRYIETPASPVTSVNGQVGVIVLGKSDVGLGNVNNTSDAEKPVSTAQAAALASKADSSHTHLVSQINDFSSGVRELLLTGLGSGFNSEISAAHTILQAFANLQAQISAQLNNSPVWIRLTSDVTTISATLVDLTGFSFSMDANTTYVVEIFARSGCNNTAGSRVGINTPVGCNTAVRMRHHTSSATLTGDARDLASGDAEIAVTINNAAVTSRVLELHMTVVNGASSGTFRMRFRSISAGQTTSIFTNSIMKISKV